MKCNEKENCKVEFGECERLHDMVEPLVEWFRENQRDLPWRKHVNAYRVWISEIMLQQTRVEAVKSYYTRFLEELPDIKALAEVPEDRLLKLWEGLGYYNRARNLKAAAQQVMEEYNGVFPDTFEEIKKLKGIGSYTAGAISSFVYHQQKPAVDGNVFRVVTRLLEDSDDIMKASTRTKIERMLEQVIPAEAPGDFNQGLIELGAIVCLPNGEPKCESCPIREFCLAYQDECQMDYPVKKKAKERRIEKRTILRFCDNEEIAIRKRPGKGLLAGLYEFPNVEGHLTQKEVIEYAKESGLTPVRVKKLPKAKHIFSHVEWHMTGYMIRVADMGETGSDRAGNADREEGSGGEAALSPDGYLLVEVEETRKHYPIPAAFEAYARYVDLPIGMKNNQN